MRSRNRWNCEVINHMKVQARSVRPICSAVAGFLGVTLIAMSFGLADKMGVIDSVIAKRAIGVSIGLMLAVIGNFVPKLRPLNSSRVQANSTAIERLSGWTLVLVGCGWIALFVFAPLNQARYAAALIGIGAVAAIAVIWTWSALRTIFDIRRESEGTAISFAIPAGPRRLISYLLFAFFFVVITACVKFLIAEKHLADQLTSWMLFVFGMLYAGLFAILEHQHARK
jgi:hypothetical protein